MKKLLAVGVIVLFLGLAFAPSINANISKASIDSELVEITTEICGINGVKPNTVSLSKEDAEGVEQLFDSIRERLNATETREEAEEIFNEAVVELDKYGLLGGLSVKQAQKLVTGGYQNSRVMKSLEKLYGKNQERNMFCLIVGATTHTAVFGPFALFCILTNILIGILIGLPIVFLCNFLDVCYVWLNFLFGLGDSFDALREFFANILFYSVLLSLVSHVVGFPFAELGGFISFGHRVQHIAGGYWNYYPANGWVWTLGLFGIKEWKGEFWGQFVNGYVGAFGFTGLRIGGSFFIVPAGDAFYLGSALVVDIGDERPYD